MNSNNRDAIDRAADRIVQNLDMNVLWPKLLEYEIFLPDYPNIPQWMENLNDLAIKKEILLSIKTRGPDAYENLLRSFDETNQTEMSNLLESYNTRRSNNNENENNIENDENQNNNNEDADLSDLLHHPSEAKEPLKVKVKKSIMFYDNLVPLPIDLYPMRSNPRGLVLLITLIKYKNYRSAAEHDEKNLEELFKQMGFKVYSARDLTTAEIKENIKLFSQNPEFRRVDSCFVIISGHGFKSEREADSVIAGIDHPEVDCSIPDKEITCGSIIEQFSAEKCIHLKNKPKVFIFQTCRGKLYQPAVPNIRGDRLKSTLSLKLSDMDNKDTMDRTRNTTRNYEDILIAHSTLPDHVSFRDKANGSWFIQILCEVFMKYAHKTHVVELFGIVDQRLKRLRIEEHCQTSVVTNIGFKHCYINPGYFENDI